MRYLSPDWMAAAGRALAGDGELAAALAGLRLTIDQVVTGGPDGDVAWRLTLADGEVRLSAAAPDDDTPAPGDPAIGDLRAGASTEPAADLRFTTDYRTAAAIAAGEVGAQRAFVEGRLRVGGNLSLLIAHQRALSAVDDALAKVRAETTY